MLRWYDAHRRELPWRAPPGVRPDPYTVWLSEIMLQQTRVMTVRPRYVKFLLRWPNVDDLARASIDEVLHAWQGLGYYSRARNLHKCAQVIVADYGGHFPDSENVLLGLPGIGPYTAAAIAAIAFGRKATPVDANVERVVSRIHGIEVPLPASRLKIRSFAERLTPTRRAGDFAQALMDLGSIICRPRSTNCSVCPLVPGCHAATEAKPSRFPIKQIKNKRPTRYGIVFWTVGRDGSVLVRRRPDNGLLGGMIEFPSTDWRDHPWGDHAWLLFAPAEGPWDELSDPVIHIFSHFRLELRVKIGKSLKSDERQFWCHPDNFDRLALPTVMKKIATVVEVSQSS